MKKRLVSLCMALALCLTLLPTTAWAADEIELRQNSASGGTLTLEDGSSYKLMEDITITSTITISGTVTLDLNGHTLTGAAGSDGSNGTGGGNGGNGGTAITVESGGALTITGSGSIIGGTGGNGGSSSKGGNGGIGGSGITVASGGSVTIVGSAAITGGNGGNGGNGGSDYSVDENGCWVSGTGGTGGSGGDGITVEGGSVTISGSSNITSGNGGTGGTGYISGTGGSSGTDIAGSDIVTVTFMKDSTTDYAKVIVPSGQKATQPTAPTREGYTFFGWSEYDWPGVENLDEDTTYLFDFNSAITKDLTLKALWQRSLSACTITVDTLPYTGSTQTPSVTITDGDKTLVKDTDYVFLSDGDSVTSATDPGTYELTIRGAWAYCGEVTVEWTINAPASSSRPTYAITVSDTDNGTVSASAKSAKSGRTVTLTVTPDAGYSLETLTVLDKNGKEVALTDKGDGTYTFTMPSGKVTVNATFVEDNSELPFFVDVPADAYYYDAVLWAAEKGITGGVDDTHFGPDLSCTRAQIVTFLWRAAGAPAPTGGSTFADVPAAAYYAQAVAWAVENGITTGVTAETFCPDRTCTRTQAVAFLFRYAALQGMDAVTLQELVSGYADGASVPGYALPAFQWALAEGVVNGDNGKLLPNDECTRAQIVTMLYRLLG